jgi:hypothetical protein
MLAWPIIHIFFVYGTTGHYTAFARFLLTFCTMLRYRLTRDRRKKRPASRK